MLAKLLVQNYKLIHGTLHLPGAGWLLRKVAPFSTGLQSFPFEVPGVGTALLDFRDLGAFGLLNASLGEQGHNAQLFDCLERLLGPGGVFWDVGANVGVVTSHLAHPRHKLARLHAFEPNPGPRRTLESLFADSKTVTVHPFGLGAADEELMLNVKPGDGSLGSTVRTFNDGLQLAIAIRRADDLVKERKIDAPNVVKIDVEGAEPSVFEGMRDTIALSRPAIVFEHLFLTDVQIRSMTPTGYRVCFISDDGTFSLEYGSRRLGHDAIMLPDESPARAHFGV